MSTTEDIHRTYQKLPGQEFEKSYLLDLKIPNLGLLTFYLDDQGMQLASQYSLTNKKTRLPLDSLPSALRVFTEMVNLTGLVVGMDRENFERAGTWLGHRMGQKLEGLVANLNSNKGFFRVAPYEGNVCFPSAKFIAEIYYPKS